MNTHTAPAVNNVASQLPRASDSHDHLVCCKNDNLTLCAFDATHIPWGEFDEPSCVVCADLGHNGVCPYGGRCPE